MISGSHDPCSAQLMRGIRTSRCFRLVSMSGGCRRTVRYVRGKSTSLVLRVPPRFRHSLLGANMTGMLISTGAMGKAGKALKDSCLDGVIGTCTARVQVSRSNSVSPSPIVGVSVRKHFGLCLSCGMFVIPTLVTRLLVVLYKFLPTLGVIDRGRFKAVRRVGIAPMDGFAFVLTGLVPC